MDKICRIKYVIYCLKKINLSATFRRIGEELYKVLLRAPNKSSGVVVAVETVQPAVSAEETANEQRLRVQINMFEDNIRNRLLSCLIILRTMSQGKSWTIFYQKKFKK